MGSDRNKWLKLMVKFAKQGKKKEAKQCLNNAVYFNNLIKK